MTADSTELREFLAFSSKLTGFTPFQLLGTGQAERYLATAIDVVGKATVRELLQAFGGVRDEAGKPDARLDEDGLLRTRILSDAKLGPVARNVIKLWFVGTWYQLPPEWREAFGAHEKDTTFVASPAAYTEGLLWPTIGANPSGAKGPGYGSWSGPPRIQST